MKKITLILLLFISAGLASAQVTDGEETLKKLNTDSIYGWHFGGVAALNFSQTALKNWSAGGLNSIALNAMSSMYGNYRKGKSTWDNTLDLGFGILRQGKNDAVSILKTDDKIDFASKYGRQAYKNFYYAGLLNFKTQFAEGYNYPNDSVIISDFLAPAYLLGAIGMDYKPSSNFTLFLAPLTAKITMVGNQDLADAGAFGVEPAVLSDAGVVTTPGENIRYEVGGYLKAMYKAELMKNVAFQVKADFFSNYLHNPQNIDVNVEALLSMKVNKYITASIATQLLYDDDIDIVVDRNNDGVMDAMPSKRLQIKEILAIGLSVQF